MNHSWFPLTSLNQLGQQVPNSVHGVLSKRSLVGKPRCCCEFSYKENGGGGPQKQWKHIGISHQKIQAFNWNQLIYIDLFITYMSKFLVHSKEPNLAYLWKMMETTDIFLSTFHFQRGLVVIFLGGWNWESSPKHSQPNIFKTRPKNATRSLGVGSLS